MKTSLLFDFTVDQSTSTVYIKREFDAALSVVWDAFTKKEILDQWWAPKPLLSKTKYMDFKAGGRRFYAMCTPEGDEHWGVQDYTSVDPTTNFKFISGFTDKDENLYPAFPRSEWNLDFAEAGGITTVSIAIKHKTMADLEKMIEMGFKEGFTMILNYLETLLKD